MNLCIHCRWHAIQKRNLVRYAIDVHACTSPKTSSPSPIDGRPILTSGKADLCEWQRREGDCGPGGAWFEK